MKINKRKLFICFAPFSIISGAILIFNFSQHWIFSIILNAGFLLAVWNGDLIPTPKKLNNGST